MPVEDLHFLAQHSVEEQFIMYVDSSRRDRSRHPTPSTYTVTFTEAFRHVVGMEVLDVLVPRTMYNVDTDVNTLAFDVEGVGVVTVRVDPQDYSMDTVADGFNAAAAVALEGRATLRAEPKTPDNPLDSGKIVFSCNRPFALDLAATSMREVIGFDEPCRPDVAAASGGHTFLGPERAGAIARPGTADGVYHTMSDLPPEADGTVAAGETAVYSFTYPRDSVIEATELVGQLAHRVELRRDPDGPDEFPYVMAGVAYELSVVVSDGGTTAYATDTPTFLPDRSSSQVSLLSSVSLRAMSHTLEPPGLVVLTGHRCIMLRCPEIEQHINSSYIYGDNSPGIALIKLATRGYTQQRFDFQSIRHRQFQPVAQLGRVTFRFETISGALYDFKGCNHTMLVAIKYLEPRVSNAFENFREHSLNPNYNPDFVQYIVNARRALDDDDDEYEDDDDDDDIGAFARKYE
jgi:hypothetical protein